MTSESSLRQEAQRWRAYNASLHELRRTLVEEFAAQHVPESVIPLAVFSCDNARFTLVLPAGASHPQLLREAPGQIDNITLALDFAQEPTAGPEFIIGGLCMSPDGTRVAYTVDGDGSDRHELRLHLLDTHQVTTLATGAGASLAWDKDTGRVLFTELDDSMRPARVYSIHPVQPTPSVIYEAAEGDGYLDVSMSSDAGTTFVAVERHGTRSIRRLVKDARRTAPLWEATAGERVFADATREHIVLLRTGGLYDELFIGNHAEGQAQTDTPRWQRIATAAANTTWDEFVLAGTSAVLVERHCGGQRLVRVSLSSPGTPAPVSFTEPDPDATSTDTAALSILPGFRTAGGELDVVKATWRSPDTWFRTDPVIRTARPHGTAPALTPGQDIEVVSLAPRSDDGTPVPLTILRPAGHNGPIPTVLYAYGAYGTPIDPAYSPFRNSLLSRGVAFAVAHVRGGGDLGPQWHHAAQGPYKYRAVQDYLACARALVDGGWTPSGSLAARARSAGAAIVGAALNRQPQWFAAAVLETPFLDCLATLSDPDAPLTELEWDEWGNPLTDAEARSALAALSPVDNVRPGPYPPLLLTAGNADSRVKPQEPARFAAAVRAKTTSPYPVLLKIDETGHLGHSEAAEDREDEADVLAFLLDQLGRIDEPESRGGKSPGMKETYIR